MLSTLRVPVEGQKPSRVLLHSLVAGKTEV